MAPALLQLDQLQRSRQVAAPRPSFGADAEENGSRRRPWRRRPTVQWTSCALELAGGIRDKAPMFVAWTLPRSIGQRWGLADGGYGGRTARRRDPAIREVADRGRRGRQCTLAPLPGRTADGTRSLRRSCRRWRVCGADRSAGCCPRGYRWSAAYVRPERSEPPPASCANGWPSPKPAIGGPFQESAKRPAVPHRAEEAGASRHPPIRPSWRRALQGR